MRRREFLGTIIMATTSGRFLIGCSSQSHQISSLPNVKQQVRPNAFLEVGPDNSITIIIPAAEMGQGVSTSLPMIIAEELNADWDLIKFKMAMTDKQYNNPTMNMQLTGGSSSVRAWWRPLATLGAQTKQIFLQAAAKSWKVPLNECYVKNNHVFHDKSKRKIRFSQLVELAKLETPPKTPQLKESSHYKLIGQPIPRLDSWDKVTGRSLFGMDVQLPEMLIASVVTSPVFGGKLIKCNKQAALKEMGVKHVVPIDHGVAVVADNYWNAQKGLAALQCEFKGGKTEHLNSKKIISRYRNKLKKQKGISTRKEGHPLKLLQDKTNLIIDREFYVPFLAHATMGPQNATADIKKDSAEIWVPTQAQTMVLNEVIALTGLKADQIKIHTTYLSGGFGRRSEVDTIRQAIQISVAIKKPVKVIWSREEDIKHDFYRPAVMANFQIVLDKNGYPEAWKNKIICPSILERVFPEWAKSMKFDFSAVEGAYNLPYDIPNIDVDFIKYDTGVPVGWWRAVGGTQHGLFIEGIINELAHTAKIDPFVYRAKMLQKYPRHLKVLDKLQEVSNWKNNPPGRYRGMAIHECFKSIVGEVVEISLTDNKKIKVEKVTAVVDCGQYVNPKIIEAQISGSIIFALTAAFKGEITLEQGKVEQSNFDNYELLTMAETPEIVVKIIKNNEDPGGVGEPGVPPLAPALVEAVFQATKKRYYSLPLKNLLA